jgi:hypothetical protein
MMTKTFPSQEHFWCKVAPQVEKELWERREKIWQLCGLYILFGSRDERFTGDTESVELITELTKFLALAMAHELQAREFASESSGGLGIGRPINHMIRYLGPELVAFFLRYSGSGGRHSVVTSIDGNLGQMEAGPLFQFAELVLLVLNKFVVDELRLRPLSPARVIRYGLAARRHGLYQ